MYIRTKIVRGKEGSTPQDLGTFKTICNQDMHNPRTANDKYPIALPSDREERELAI